MENLINASNGSEIRFKNVSGKFAKTRTLKDKWGNVLGVKVANQDGDEFRVTEDNGQTVIAPDDAIAAVPNAVGNAAVMGDADWFEFEVGGFTVTA